MSRVSDIILRVRDTLADPSGDRWSDERLLRLIDEAQKDICRRAKLLRTQLSVGIINSNANIKLPEDMLLLDRIIFMGKVLPLVSHLELDRKSDTWEEDVGMPEAIVYDKQNRGYAKLYPLPVSLDLSTYSFRSPGYAESTTPDDNIAADPDFGIVTDIEGLGQNSLYGILTSVSDNNPRETYRHKNLGVTTRIDETESLITIYYLKKPKDISELKDLLDIDTTYDIAIKYYVTGKALRDDMDTQNRAVGNEELGFYERELREAISDDTFDFTRNNTQYNTTYKGAF